MNPRPETLRATVIIPTHNHGRTLWYAARSVLTQTVSELELIIIGDGASSEGRQTAEDLERADARVRFLDQPKGPRLGERYRHAALHDARGAIVCYLSDDDLWLPHHVETLERLLSDADFAHTLSVYVTPEGSITAANDVDFRVRGVQEAVAAGTLGGGAGLSTMAHTMALYRQLPIGWDTTPDLVATDTHMCRKLVGHPGCRAVTAGIPTVLRFPSKPRKGWSTERRAAELESWSRRVADPTWMSELTMLALDSVAREDAEKRYKLSCERDKRRRSDARVAALMTTLKNLRAKRDRLAAALRSVPQLDAATKDELACGRDKQRKHAAQIVALRSALHELKAKRDGLAAVLRSVAQHDATTKHKLSDERNRRLKHAARIAALRTALHNLKAERNRLAAELSLRDKAGFAKSPE